MNQNINIHIFNIFVRIFVRIFSLFTVKVSWRWTVQRGRLRDVTESCAVRGCNDPTRILIFFLSSLPWCKLLQTNALLHALWYPPRGTEAMQRRLWQQPPGSGEGEETERETRGFVEVRSCYYTVTDWKVESRLSFWRRKLPSFLSTCGLEQTSLSFL